MTRTYPLGRAQRLVLAYLADQGPLIATPGTATAALADAIGVTSSHAGNLLKRLERLGHLDLGWEGHRLFRIGISHRGRRTIGREADWHRRQRQERERPAAPAMPVVGAIGRLGPVDVDASREAAAKAAVL